MGKKGKRRSMHLRARTRASVALAVVSEKAFPWGDVGSELSHAGRKTREGGARPEFQEAGRRMSGII